MLNAYTPVQEAKAEQDSRMTQAREEAVRAAETASVTPIYPPQTADEAVVSFTV